MYRGDNISLHSCVTQNSKCSHVVTARRPPLSRRNNSWFSGRIFVRLRRAILSICSKMNHLYLILHWARSILKWEWACGVSAHPNFQKYILSFEYLFYFIRVCFQTKLPILELSALYLWKVHISSAPKRGYKQISSKPCKLQHRK